MRRNRRGHSSGMEFGGSGEDSFVAVVVTKLTGALLFILLLTMVIMALLPKVVDLPSSPGAKGSGDQDKSTLTITTPEDLPEGIAPEHVRSALTAVMKRMAEAPGTFDKNGWLQIGFCGHQQSVGEAYISTGSLYLCSAVFLPLGLRSSDPFWSAPEKAWTAKRIWSGADIPADHAISN